MLAAVDLEELALARHPLAAAAVPCRAAGPGRTDRGLGQDPAERSFGDRDPLALGQQLGQVRVVHADVGRRGQVDHATPELVVNPVGGRPAPIAVGERRRTVGVAGDQAVDLTGRKAEDLHRLVERQAAGDDMVENVGAVLTPRVGLGLSVLGFHAPEGDRIAGRLTRTESLAVHTHRRQTLTTVARAVDTPRVKLVVAIVHSEDAGALVNALLDKEFRATRLQSSGGFLKQSNATIILGVEDADVDEVMGIVRTNCTSRTQVVNPMPPIMEPGEFFMPYPLEVEVGGATVFVLPVERFERL